MGCVYKEVALKQNGKWIPKIKLSNDTIKIVNPGHKKLYRAFDKNTGFAIADIMANKNENSTAIFLDKPKTVPPIKVEPDLETPGIKAKI